MKGFTLIEILVVIAIMGILGTAGYINYRAFSYEQVLDDGVTKIQSILRQAQTNATASIKCKGVGSTRWLVAFKDRTVLELQCVRSDNLQIEIINPLNLTNNVEINSISGESPCPAGTVCGQSVCTSSLLNPTDPVTVSFDTLSGKVSFNDPLTSCIATLSDVTVTIRHTQDTSLSKNIFVGKGGGINAQN